MRFERTARTLASLNHRHIAQVHGLEWTGATRAIIMELVEGEDLGERLARGALPIDEAMVSLCPLYRVGPSGGEVTRLDVDEAPTVASHRVFFPTDRVTCVGPAAVAV